MIFLNSHCAGQRYFKDSSTVFPDIMCYDKAVAFPNKNNNNYNKKMEICR